jgi:hypothetical protein
MDKTGRNAKRALGTFYGFGKSGNSGACSAKLPVSFQDFPVKKREK